MPQVGAVIINFLLFKEIYFVYTENHPGAPNLCAFPFLVSIEALGELQRRLIELLLLFSLYRTRFPLVEQVNVFAFQKRMAVQAMKYRFQR